MEQKMKERENTTFVTGFLLTLLLLGVIGIAAAANTDTIDIDINITQQVKIDVNPNSTNWTGVDTGSTTTPHAFEIQNIGSLNISTIDANITNAGSMPYGTGDATNFNAGDFILLNTSWVGFRYINKIEFNESKPSYVTPPDGWVEGNATGYFGRFRTASDSDEGQEYFFFTNMTNGSSGDCAHNGSILIGNSPKTLTQSGTTDFSGSDFVIVYTTNNTGSTYGIGDIPASHALDEYCVAIKDDCSEVIFFHFNKALDTAGNACSEDEYVFSGTLEPGNETEIWLEAKVPLGVSDGDVSTGTLTLIASQ